MSRYVAMALVSLLLSCRAIVCGADARPGDMRKQFREGRDELQKAIRKKDWPAAGEAMKTIARTDSVEAARYLLTLGDLESAEAFQSLQEALALFENDKVYEALGSLYKRARGRKRWADRVLILDAAGHKDTEDVRAMLEEAIRDDNPKVRLAAIRATMLSPLARDAKGPLYLEGLAQAEKADDFGTPHFEARRGLTKITGRDNRDAASWTAWWEAHGKDPVQGDPSLLEPEPLWDLDYYTEPITSQRVLFIIDMSFSMWFVDHDLYANFPKEIEWTNRGKGGADRFSYTVDGHNRKLFFDWLKENPEAERVGMVRAEMKKLIEKLEDERFQFNIYAFNSRIDKWRGEPVAANEPNKKSALQWVEKLVPKGHTDTESVLKEALAKSDVIDTIYFLSDGYPSKDGKKYDPTEPILDMVSQLNRYARVIIHTFSVGDADEEFMKKLAEQNRGNHRLCRGELAKKNDEKNKPEGEPENQPEGE